MVCNKRAIAIRCPSMKVPPKRKGNRAATTEVTSKKRSLNESPSEKEGKWRLFYWVGREGLDPQ